MREKYPSGLLWAHNKNNQDNVQIGIIGKHSRVQWSVKSTITKDQ